LAEYSWKDFEKPPLSDPNQLQQCRCWLLAGEENWLCQQFQEILLAALLSREERAWGLEVFRLSPALLRSKPGEGSWARALLRSVTTFPFFSRKRVVIVEGVHLLAGGEQEEIAAALENLPENAVLILSTSERAGGKKGQASGESSETEARGRLSARLCQAMRKCGNLVRFEPLSEKEAIAWAEQETQRAEKRLERSAATLLVQKRVGRDLGRLKKEIDKLVLFVGSRSFIRCEDVAEVTPRVLEEKIWDLTDALGKGKAGRATAVAVLRGMMKPTEEAGKAKAESLRILALLARHFRLLWQTKALLERGWKPGDPVRDSCGGESLLLTGRHSAARVFPSQPWLAGKYADQARRFTWPRLEEAFLSLLQCDLALKGLSAPSRPHPGLALELTLLALSGQG